MYLCFQETWFHLLVPPYCWKNDRKWKIMFYLSWKAFSITRVTPVTNNNNNYDSLFSYILQIKHMHYNIATHTHWCKVSMDLQWMKCIKKSLSKILAIAYSHLLSSIPNSLYAFSIYMCICYIVRNPRNLQKSFENSSHVNIRDKTCLKCFITIRLSYNAH